MKPSLSALLSLAVLLPAAVTWAAAGGAVEQVPATGAVASAAASSTKTAGGARAAFETAVAKVKASAKSIDGARISTSPSHKPLSRAASTKAKKKEVAARGGRRLEELVSGDSVGNYQISTTQSDDIESFFTQYSLTENEDYFQILSNSEAYQTMQMPMDLSFFETTWANALCISSTGYMSFCDSECESGNWGNLALPSDNVDGAMLAPFWSDLDLTRIDTSAVYYGYYYDDENMMMRIFLQWKDIGYVNDVDGETKMVNMEVEFANDFSSMSTNIRIRYFGLDDFPLDQSYTAGLQDSDGTTGLSFTLPDAVTNGINYEVELVTTSSSSNFEYVDCNDNTPSPAGISFSEAPATWGGYNTEAPVSWTTNYEGSTSKAGAYWNLTVGMDETEDCFAYQLKVCLSGANFGEDDCSILSSSSSSSSSSSDKDDSSSSDGGGDEPVRPGESFSVDLGWVESGSGENTIKWYISTNKGGSESTGDYTMIRLGFGVDDDESVYSSHTYASADGGIHSSMEMFYEELDDGAFAMMSINLGCGDMTPSPAGFATASPTASPGGFDSSSSFGMKA